MLRIAIVADQMDHTITVIMRVMERKISVTHEAMATVIRHHTIATTIIPSIKMDHASIKRQKTKLAVRM